MEAEAALRRADERGDWAAAFSLGVLLRDRGDAAGAVATFERAAAGQGLGRAGAILIGVGDIDGGETAWQQAAARGDAEAAFALGLLLFDLDDVDGAEAGWRQADAQGHAEGALRLGRLLAGRSDDAEAQAAFARAMEHGNDQAAVEADQLRQGFRFIARAQQERTEDTMTLSPQSAQAMADALRERPAWLRLVGTASPGLAMAVRRAPSAARRRTGQPG